MENPLRTYAVAAACVGVLLTVDATPRADFPEVDELLAMELARLLGNPLLIRAHRVALASYPTRHLLELPPWAAKPKDLRNLLAAYSKDLVRCRVDGASFGKELLDTCHKDPFSLPPRVKHATDATARDIALDACDLLAIRDPKEVDEVVRLVREKYTSVHSALAIALK